MAKFASLGQGRALPEAPSCEEVAQQAEVAELRL